MAYHRGMMTTNPDDDRQTRATQAGCSAVTDQFDRFRAHIVCELARCTG
jgi:hypothetical protein